MTQKEKIERYGIDKVNEWKEREKENARRKRMGLPPLDKMKKVVTTNETRYRIKVTSKAESKFNRMDEIASVERKVQKELSILWSKIARRPFILISSSGNLNVKSNKFDIKIELYMLNLTKEEIEEFKATCKKYAETLKI